jgi:hypothetical protein
MSAEVVRIFASPEQVRVLVHETVCQAVAQVLIDTNLHRLGTPHLNAALEGIIDALTFCTFSYTPPESRLDSARDNANMHARQMLDMVNADHGDVIDIPAPNND